MTTSKTHFLDPVAAYRELQEEMLSVVETALDTAGFIVRGNEAHQATIILLNRLFQQGSR